VGDQQITKNKEGRTKIAKVECRREGEEEREEEKGDLHSHGLFSFLLFLLAI
jgi:hypothetical protein